MTLPAALESALLAAAPSAIEVLPRLIAAACAGRRQAAADELEEFMRRQAFEAAQRLKREARKNRAPTPAPVRSKPARPRRAAPESE